MLSPLPLAIVKTLAYADIFDFPLTEEEIWRWLIKFKIQSAKCLPVRQVGKVTVQSLKLITHLNGFYFLKKRQEIITLRMQKQKYSIEKMSRAKNIIELLRYIPTIKLIGVSGALSMKNAAESDDIDLFIITKKECLWITRFLVTLLVTLTGQRRKRQDESIKNKICLNMFMDENNLAIPKREQDLFSAHEVLQMKPLWEKEDAYKDFLTSNSWVKEYLPNAYSELIEQRNNRTMKKNGNSLLNRLVTRVFHFFETFSKYIQLWYMKNHRTTEVIKVGYVRFHPRDVRIRILPLYQATFKKYHIPLDND